MPLLIKLRQLEKQPLTVAGELPAAELDWEGVDECIRVVSPLAFELEVQLVGAELLAQGELRLALECDCVRCLKVFRRTLHLPGWSCVLQRQGEGTVEAMHDCVDLTPQVREDILLAFPQHPLCEPGCHRLPHSPVSGVHQPGKVQATENASSVWAELNKLKF